MRKSPRSRALASASAPAERQSSRGVRATWVAYVCLLLLSIPWYFPAGSGAPLVFGFPLWCFVALAAYTLAALLTVWRLDALWEAGQVGRGRSEEPSAER